ncbi:unnamed protein product, partial [Allacma fusca]
LVIFVFRFLPFFTAAEILPKRPTGFPPGPLPCPFVGNLPLIFYHGSLHKTFQSLIPKYGPIFSVFIGPTPAVVLNSIDTHKDAGKLDAFQGRADIPPFTLWDDAGDGNVGGIAFSEGEIHAEQRTFVVKTLRQLTLSSSTVSIENFFIEEITSLIDHLRTVVGQPLDIRPHLAEVTENVLRKYLVGIPNEDTDSVQKYKKVVLAPGNALITRPISSFFVSFFPKLSQLFPRLSGYNLVRSENEASNQMLRQIIENHRSVGTPVNEDCKRLFVHSYLDQIERTTDDRSTFYGQMGLRNLAIVIKDLSTGGSEAVSEQTTWFVLYLLLHPNMRMKIVEEIETIVGFSRVPTKDDFNSMHYTQATLQEVVRITSFVLFGLLNKTLATTKFHGFVIPKGTMVIKNSHACHHDKSYWGDPENFRPERFLDDQGKLRRDENMFAFGSGRRVCVGETQGRFAMLYFITLFLQNFKLSVDSSKPMPTLEGVETIGLTAKPFRIVLHHR